MSRSSLTSFLRQLPKAELHLHVEGTVTPETMAELSARHPDLAPLSVEDVQALYHYTDFQGFLMAFKAITSHLRSPEDYEFITWRMLQHLATQGVVHAEVYISVGVIFYWRREELDNDPALFEKIFVAMERARKRGQQELGVTLYWIFDAVRHFGVEEAGKVFAMAASMRQQYPSIIGIGLGGDERRGPAEQFAELYLEAHKAGLRLTVHAGESAGPESIWAALNIGAERIGHGLTAIHDPELMEMLAERQVPIEICITSNLRTACCASLAEHPVRRYFDDGLMIILNSDDPALFESNLEQEYELAANEFAFTCEQLRELAANSIEASFLDAERKVTLLRYIAEMPEEEADGEEKV